MCDSCDSCGSTAPLRDCTGCHKVRYCSKDCQRDAWRNGHKQTCSRPTPVLLITGCKKYEPYLHAAIRRMTHSAWEVIGIIGSNDVSGDATFDDVTRILTLPVMDIYEALPSKIHAAFAWIARERPFTSGVFKTDDDMMFDVNELARTVQEKCAIPYWGVYTGQCPATNINMHRILHRFSDTSLRPSHQQAVYCYGAGYWISGSSMPHIVAAQKDYSTSFLEDVCTGFVMNRAGITPVRASIAYKECARQ